MTRTTLWTTFGIPSIVLLIVIVAISRIDTPANTTFGDGSEALLFIGAVAVAIERVIEGFWTVVGSGLGTYWPLNAVTRHVNALVGELDISLEPFHEEIERELKDLSSQGKITEQQFLDATSEITRLKSRFNELKNLSPDNQRVQLLIAAASQNVDYITKKYGSLVGNLKTAGEIAQTTISGMQNFLATFKDNPGRRLISLYLGTVLGLIVSVTFGLDLFHDLIAGPSPFFKKMQIILTGIVMGLGSSPTHEVIRAVQEYKKSQKGSNISNPNLPEKA